MSFMPTTGGFSNLQGSGRKLTQGLIAGALVCCVGLSAAEAFPFIGKKKGQQPSIPPATEIKPNMMQPGGAPAAIPAATTVAPLTPIQILINRGLFPPDAASRTQPITRAEWADVLVKTLGHNTSMISEFPFYRDVPVDYPAYAEIEVARSKRLLTYEQDHGFYYPEQPIRYADVYASLAQAITAPNPDAEQIPHLLRNFSDRDALSPALATAVAKMARVSFFRTPVPQTSLHPNEEVTYQGATHLITYLIHLNERRAPLAADQDEALPYVLPGLTLTLSPTTAILEAQMVVGQAVNFNLVKPVGPLPKESRFEGQVIEAKPSARTYIVQLTSVKTTEGAQFRTLAEFSMSLSPRTRITFFVPGEMYTSVTRLPAMDTQATPPLMLPAEPVPALPGNQAEPPPLEPPATASPNQPPSGAKAPQPAAPKTPK